MRRHDDGSALRVPDPQLRLFDPREAQRDREAERSRERLHLVPPGPEPEPEPEPAPEPASTPEPVTGRAAGASPEPVDWQQLVEVEGPRDRGLELLVDLVKSGTVDPWDVDLRVVAGRFMEAIDALRPQDLPSSGRLLFFASVIIRLKAQWLAGRGADILEVPDEGASLEDVWDDDMEDVWDDFSDALLPSGRGRRRHEDVLLLPKEQVRKRRPLTIQDLLDALDKAEQHEKKMERRRSCKEKVTDDRFDSVEEAMDTLHQDDFERDVSTARRLVDAALEAGDGGAGMEVFEGQLDPISAYLSLLFLAAHGEVNLEQERFYGALSIHRGDPASIKDFPAPRPRYVPRSRPRKEAPVGDEAAEDTGGDEAAAVEAEALACGEDPGGRSEALPAAVASPKEDA